MKKKIQEISKLIVLLILCTIVVWAIFKIIGVGVIVNNRWNNQIAHRDELERLCFDRGFDVLYIYEEVSPPAYYCVQLPAVGDIGLVIRIPDDILEPTPGPDQYSEMVIR